MLVLSDLKMTTGFQYTNFGISSRIWVHLLTLVLWLRSSLAYLRNYGGVYPENHK